MKAPLRRGRFERYAHRVSDWAGTPPMFFAAVVLVVGWLLSGPLFGFSDTWQLVINTGTTIVTFLMVFLIQAAQNRDTREIKRDLEALKRERDTAEGD